MRVRVLIGGTDDWHDILGAGAMIRDALLRDGIAATLHLGWSEMQRGGDETRVLVVCTMAMRMTRDEQAAMAALVEGGRGLVAVHASAVPDGTPEQNATWLGLIGCRFVTHPPHCRFRVAIDKVHPVTEGMKDFEIEDELYVTEPVGDPVTVLASAEYEGKKAPMVTVHERGKGRVCFVALGHDARSYGSPSFQGIMARAVRWAAGDQPGR